MKRVIYMFLIICFLTACAGNEDGTSNNTPIEPSKQLNSSTNEIATHLSELALTVPHVTDAETLIIGPYATVAIDLEKNLDDARVGSVKYTVSEALHQDKYGKTAVVIAEANMVERFREMRDKIAAGEPIQGVMEELAEIVNRYMPTLPIEDSNKQEEHKPNQTNEQNDHVENEQEAPIELAPSPQ